MPGLSDVAHGLTGILQPLTGDVAAGKATLLPAVGVTGDVILPPNQWLYPVVNNGLRPDMTIRVMPNQAAGTAGDWKWTIPPAGLDVDVTSVVGGQKHNLPAGTVLRWAEEVPEGFANDGRSVVAAGGLTGATNTPSLGSDLVRSVVIYESLGMPKLSLEMFRAKVGDLPAIVIVWDGSDPSPTFVGRGRKLYGERWSAILITARGDDSNLRRGETLRILDNMEDLLVWQNIYGDPLSQGNGVIVSQRTSSDVLGRFRMNGSTPAYQQHYVYGVRLATQRLARRVRVRASIAKPWLKTRIDGYIDQTNPPTDLDPLTMASDVEVDMTGASGAPDTGWTDEGSDPWRDEVLAPWMTP